MKNCVDDFFTLNGQRLLPAGEVVHKDGPKEHLADDVHDLVGWQGTKNGLFDHRFDFRFPATAVVVVLAVEERGGLAVAEMGPLLDHQFEILAVLVEEREESHERGPHPLQRIDWGSGGCFENGLTELASTSIGRGEEQPFLGAEVAIDGPFTHACAVGDFLNVGRGKPALGKDFYRGRQNVFRPFGVAVVGAVSARGRFLNRRFG